MDALRTHPMVVVDAMTHDNPYYIDPGELLRRTGTGSGEPAGPRRRGPAQLSALRSVLILSMLLTRQDDQASILDIVANAVGSLGPCRTEGIFLDGRW